jgi:hypothetical protein
MPNRRKFIVKSVCEFAQLQGIRVTKRYICFDNFRANSLLTPKYTYSLELLFRVTLTPTVSEPIVILPAYSNEFAIAGALRL